MSRIGCCQMTLYGSHLRVFMPPSGRAYSNRTVRPSVSQSVSLSVSPSVTKLVRTVTPTCFSATSNNLVWMFTTLRRRVASKTRAPTSKVKVINWGQRSKMGPFRLVRSVTPTCLSGIWNNLVQMFTTLRRRVALKIQAHTSKVKVISWGQRSYWGHLSLYCDPTLVFP